jgi:hypothetical protein
MHIVTIAVNPANIFKCHSDKRVSTNHNKRWCKHIEDASDEGRVPVGEIEANHEKPHYDTAGANDNHKAFFVFCIHREKSTNLFFTVQSRRPEVAMDQDQVR